MCRYQGYGGGLRGGGGKQGDGTAHPSCSWAPLCRQKKYIFAAEKERVSEGGEERENGNDSDEDEEMGREMKAGGCLSGVCESSWWTFGGVVF